MFGETDLDAALARFEELSQPARRLENTAAQRYERFWTNFAARDWAAMAEIMTDDISSDDRRRVVGAGVRHGRDAQIADMRAVADLGITNVTSTVMATRGERLILTRARYSGRDQGPDAYLTEVLGVYEQDAEDLIAAVVTFDFDDIDAAFAELDARYAAGEAAAHAHTWSVIASAYAGLNRRELAATTPDWVNIDHRRGIAAARGDLTPYIRAAWDVMAHIKEHIEAVHRLTNLGAVVTRVSKGTSKEGFDAEWREIDVTTVEGDLINRSEKFDEEDIDAALARFDELNRPVPQLENAAIRTWARQIDALNRRDVDGFLAGITEDGRLDDRRKGLRAVMEGSERQRAFRELFTVPSSWRLEMEPIAIRGSRLSLTRERSRDTDDVDRPITIELLTVIEIGNDDLVHDTVSFDPDDIDAAFEELDARYLAGEAAAHSHTWSLITRNYAAFNGHEFPSAAPDWVTIDHRRGTSMEPGDLTAYIRSAWDVAPDMSVYIEAVHRVSDLGAVITQVSKGTSQQAFEAEWREICLLTVDGELFSGCELFDEPNLDAALERFEELHPQTRQLENAASRVLARVWASFATRDWDAVAETMAEDFSSYDHRRVVNAGVRRGRDIHVTNMRAVSDVGFENVGSTVIATRGQCLALSRTHSAVRGMPPDEVGAEAIMVVEIDADNRLAVNALFDLDDIDTAFAELDARYLAGEAAAHSHTWSVIAKAYTSINRHEMPPTTPDWVNVDHRRGIASAPGDLLAYVRAAWDLTPDIGYRIEAVHRMSSLGAVVTHASKGTSQGGFDAEWRVINLLMVGGDLISRAEVFDEEDLDAALARFDELSRPAVAVENVATRAWVRLADAFNRRDIDCALALTAADGQYEDRRKGLHDKGTARDVWPTVFDAPKGWRLEMEPVAIRGSRLGLTRGRFRDTDYADQPITVEYLTVTGVSDDDLMHDTVIFDLDDIDAAFAELDARYLAGEAAAYSHTWSLIAQAYAAFNRHELSRTSPDWVNIDHRRGIGSAPGDMLANVSALWEVAPDISITSRPCIG